MSINSVYMVGRLARDPQVKEIKGYEIVNLSICTSHKSKSKDGSTKEDICFVDAVVWGAQAQWCKTHVKGDVVAVEGRLKQETWDDKTTGQKRSKHVIQVETIMFPERINKISAENPMDEQPRVAAKPQAKPQQKNDFEFTDELPF